MDQIQLTAGVVVTENMIYSGGRTLVCHPNRAGKHKSHILQLTVNLFQEKVHEVSVSCIIKGGHCYLDPNSSFSYRIFACKHKTLHITTHIPLYTDPARAFKSQDASEVPNVYFRQ